MQPLLSQPRLPRRPRRINPLRALIGMICFMLGSSIAWLGRAFLRLGQHAAGDRTLHSWQQMIDQFHAVPVSTSQPHWEQRLWRVGPSVLLAIGGALLLLWTLLAIGGALAWLALNGFGFWLLAGAITCGVIAGSWIGLLRAAARRNRLN